MRERLLSKREREWGGERNRGEIRGRKRERGWEGERGREREKRVERERRWVSEWENESLCLQGEQFVYARMGRKRERKKWERERIVRTYKMSSLGMLDWREGGREWKGKERKGDRERQGGERERKRGDCLVMLGERFGCAGWMKYREREEREREREINIRGERERGGREGKTERGYSWRKG
jgi:hypothetical protein